MPVVDGHDRRVRHGCSPAGIGVHRLEIAEEAHERRQDLAGFRSV
ncbi:MAG TPA: hypothetical protein VJO52_10525 [Gemmatimonadaceae bacterium]|nr:hypothetical protein [Gemmatimonadaceae bacterium]